MKRLAIITTHPIQYYAPVFQLLHERNNIQIMVFYTSGALSNEKFDPGFMTKIKWDIPLLQGYPYQWAENVAQDPGSHHFKGISCPALTQQIEIWQPDAMLCYGWCYDAHLKTLRHFHSKIPIFFRGDSHCLNKISIIRTLLRWTTLKWVYRNIDHAFYVGSNNKTYFEQYTPNNCRLTFAPHAIDNKRFMADHYNEAAQLRQSLGIREDELVVLYAGKFQPVKNVILLLRVFLRMNKTGVHLLLAGNGGDEARLKAMARPDTSKNIHFIDFQNQSQMAALYQSADIFCLPSLSESWGLSVNEAMASGVALLVSDRVGCAVDLVTDSNGLIFRSGSDSSLEVQLGAMIGKGKSTLKKMGRQSRSIISNWSFENQVNAIETALINHE